MPGILHEVDCIAASGEKLLMAVSLGRDTACFMHALSKKVRMQDHAYFHYTTYCTMLPYHARQLRAIEDRYGIGVEVRPDPRSLASGIVGVAEDRDYLLDKHGCGLCVLGYRMDESLQRRGMLKRHTDGIDRKTRECYPLRSWTSRITDAYVRTHRIPLAPEYALGMRDMPTHRGTKAVILRHWISEEDYQAAIAQDPQVEVDYVRHEQKNRAVLAAAIRGGDDPS